MPKFQCKSSGRSVAVEVGTHGDWVTLTIAEDGLRHKFPIDPEVALQITDAMQQAARVIAHKRAAKAKGTA